MAENYISQAYTWVTGNTITAARLNANETAVISGLSDGTKSVNIGKLLIGAQVVFTLASTDINVTNLNTVSMKNDLTVYKPSNDGNPKIVIGASATEALFVTAEFASGTQTLQTISFTTKTASATADYGKFTFNVDETEVLKISDALVTVTGGLTVTGTITGNVTGNCSGTAATVTGAAQTAITSLGTLTGLTVTAKITGSINGNCDGSAGSVAASAITGNTLASGVTASSLTSVGTLSSLTIGGTLALGTNSITMTGSIGSTGSRVTKLWATDITCTNNISAGLTGNVTGNCSGSSGTCTGLAGSATILATARAINGVNFDGSAPITVTADANTLTGTTLKSTITASSLTSVGTLASLAVSGAVSNGNPQCRVYRTSAFTATNGAQTYDLTWDAENYDTDSMHSTSVNTERITINTGGTYIITASIDASKNVGYLTYVRIDRYNSSNVLQEIIAVSRINALSGQEPFHNMSGLAICSATDYIKCTVYSDQNTTTFATGTDSSMAVIKIR